MERIDMMRQTAWDHFNRGEFEAAASVLLALSNEGELEIADLHALVEILFDRHEWLEGIAAIDRALEKWQTTSEAEPRIPWLTLQFDLVTRNTPDAGERRVRAMHLLEALAGSNDAGVWGAVVSGERLVAIESSFEIPLDRLEAYEQEAYAPGETRLPERAKSMIEEIGLVHSGDTGVARAAERLLHAIGETEAAYRVEHARRASVKSVPIVGPAAIEPVFTLRDMVIVLAGGHPALRSMIERDLIHSGAAEVRSVPSATEAIRSGRNVQALLAGADLVVLLVRQLAHSTSDQVRRAAGKTGVPVVIAETAGLSGVRRAIERFVRERQST
jgi:hypothetical protein